MNREETTKILSYIKASYHAHFKDMSKEDMVKILSLWERKFADVPADLMFIAVDDLISSNKFPPNIAEVTEKLTDIYWKNFDFKWASDCGTLLLSAEEKRRVDYIHKSLAYIVDGGESATLIGGSESKKMLLGG